MMQLLPEEQKRLDLIDWALRAEAPTLATKFDMFARLARGEGKPPPEKQFRADGAWYKAFVRQRARRDLYAVLGLLLATLVLVLTFELA